MSAIKYLKSVSPVLKSTGGLELKCENLLFRLHNNFTVGFLIASSVLLGATEYFGKPINCISSVPSNIINTYCWITTTFTMNDYSFREIGSLVAAPGVGNEGLMSVDSFDDDLIQKKWQFHNYYQWVVFFLCFQAFMFYLPKYIWNMCEGGLMKCVSENLSKSLFKESEISNKKDLVINYIISHLRAHDLYAYKYWACELLCFINVILQIYLIDSFLGGAFLQYGMKVVEFSDMDQTDRVDPMIYVFPRMTKCTFHMYGASGTVNKLDAFCLLAQNILNEKIFIFLWFWFIILATLLGGLVAYRALLILLRNVRPRIIYLHTKMVPLDILQVINRNSSIGDWWFLYILAGTIDANIYREVIMKVAKEIQTSPNNCGRPVYPSISEENGNGGFGAPCSSKSSNGNMMYPNRGYNPPPASAPPTSYAQSAV